MKRKKKIVLLTVISWILMILGMVLGALFSIIKPFKPVFADKDIRGVLALVKSIPHFLKLVFRPASGGLLNITTLSFLGVVAFFVILGIVLLFKIGYKKNIKAHGVWFEVFWLLFGAAFSLVILALFSDGFLPTIGEAVYSAKSFGGITYLFKLTLSDNAFVNVLLKILGLLPLVLFLVGFILILIAFFRDMSLLGKTAEEVAYKEACEAAERNGQKKPSKKEFQEEGKEEEGPEEKGASVVDGKGLLHGPILVQYINTQTGEVQPVQPAPKQIEEKPAAVSIEEVKAAINGQKQMTVEDIRKIIQEEFARERLENEVATTKSNPSELSEILKRQLDDEQPLPKEEPQPIVVPTPVKEVEPAKKEVVEEKQPEPAQTISQGDIQSVIRDELLMFQQAQAEAEEARKAEQEKRAQELNARREEEWKAREEEYRRQLEEAARLKAEKEAVEEALRKLQAEEASKKGAPESSLTPEQIKQLIADALSEKQNQPTSVETQESLSGDDIRAIIRDELASFQPASAPSPVVVNLDTPAENAPVEEAPVAVEVPEQKRVVGAINPNLPPHEKIVRIPFPTRMVDADDLMKSNYNELKSELMAYGLKSRVSNSGDTFRLHKVTYVKIAIAGKSLKLYMALDPKDYADSSLPISDVGAKNTYKDIPFVFKVKSPLSMRRAKQLIADLMDKHDLEQAKVNPHNWADELKDYKPTGQKEEEE